MRQEDPSLPAVADRAAFQAELDELRVREKAHTREADAIAAARRRLPMTEVDAGLELLGPDGPVTLLDAFAGRRQLIAYYFMWHPGHPAREQCEGCTFYTSQVTELSGLHSRDISYAVFCQGRNVSMAGGDPRSTYDASLRYRDFMGWDVPWYSAQPSLDALLTGREVGLFHLVCYVRDGNRVFETYLDDAARVRAAGAVGGLAPGLAQQCTNVRTEAGAPDWPPAARWPGGRPLAQWPRLAAGRSDEL